MKRNKDVTRMTELQEAIQEIRYSEFQAEIKVRDDGVGFASIRAVARLCGISNVSLANHFKGVSLNPSKLAQSLMSNGFEGVSLESFADEGIPDRAIALIVEHYAFDAGRYCTKQARDYLRAYTAIGIRAWMQDIAGWVAPEKRRLTKEEIAELCVIGGGTEWTKRFDDVYYEQLAQLTGLTLESNGKRPKLFGALTNEFVYGLLPEGVSQKLRQCRKETGGWKRLHQFLSEDGLEVFHKHMQMLLTLMKAARSTNDLRRMLQKSCASAYQMQLFNDSRKDGTLTIRKAS